MKNQPNILFIMADQHRFDCTGYSNRYPVKTPNIDRIARDGIWFENAYTPIPICCPSRQSLICGRRSESFGALWNYDITLPVQSLSPTSFSWVKQLQNSGYYNSFIGRWHLSPDHGPLEFGYDKHVPNWKGQHSSGYFGETCAISEEESDTWHMSDIAIKELECYKKEQTDKPWNMTLCFEEPHLPCNPVSKYASMYSADEVPKWDGFDENFENKPYILRQQLLNWSVENMTWDDWAPVVARYYAIISQMDNAVGRVLDKLDQLGLSDNTIVIYTSDHGDMCGSHRMLDKHYILYEDVTHVPLAIRWPGVIPKGCQTKAYTMHFLDLVPTLLDCCNQPYPLQSPGTTAFHGKSLIDILQSGGTIPKGWRTEAVSTYNGQQFGLYTQRCIKVDGWKYIWNLTDIDELYDLSNDKGELINLIKRSEYSEALSNLRQRLYDTLVAEDDWLTCRNGHSWLKRQLLEGYKLD